MAFRVELAPRAFQDLNEITNHIKTLGSAEQAGKWLDGILEAIGSLRRLAARCPVAAESADLGFEVRRLVYGRRNRGYKVYFAIHDATETVRIFHVRHWARRLLASRELLHLAREGPARGPAAKPADPS